MRRWDICWVLWDLVSAVCTRLLIVICFFKGLHHFSVSCFRSQFGVKKTEMNHDGPKSRYDQGQIRKMQTNFKSSALSKSIILNWKTGGKKEKQTKEHKVGATEVVFMYWHDSLFVCVCVCWSHQSPCDGWRGVHRLREMKRQRDTRKERWRRSDK